MTLRYVGPSSDLWAHEMVLIRKGKQPAHVFLSVARRGSLPDHEALTPAASLFISSVMLRICLCYHSRVYSLSPSSSAPATLHRVSVSHGGWAWLCEMSTLGVCSRVFWQLGWRLSQSARLRVCVRVETARPRVARVPGCARKNAAAVGLASPQPRGSELTQSAGSSPPPPPE